MITIIVRNLKKILKKQIAFELTLRRIPKKVDFLRYAEYEMNLEVLCRKRVERLSVYHSTTYVCPMQAN